ncbi:MAG: sulfite exporter TauE/SafE family protein [Acidimicrobiales bacterium]
MIGEIIAIVLGLGVGLSLGALGGGGSTLAVPILVFIAGMATKDATSASLLVVGVASAIGAWGHYRNGYVKLQAGLAFGAAGIVGSRIGTTINRSLPEKALLLAFSGLILFVAVRMLRSAKRAEAAHAAGTTPPSSPTPSSSTSGGVATQTKVLPTSTPALDLSPRSVAKLVAAASGVGLLTGLFGVGGGFAVVPALTLLLGFSTKDAIGTSLVVISINTAIALALRSGHLDFDWGLVLPFLATVTFGVLVGSRLANKIDAARLTKSFAIMLALVAVYTAGGAVLS